MNGTLESLLVGVVGDESYDRAALAAFIAVVVPRLIDVEPIRFDGQNCDECPGWDGLSRRCECGNRRVYWEYNAANQTWTPTAW